MQESGTPYSKVKTMAAAFDRDKQRQREAEEIEIGPLLARANLLRMRGQWDEAVAACMDALRKAPESAAAHLLLGEIYEAQGKADDALPWYTMALEHNPGSAPAREKLERLQEAQRIRLRAETAPPKKEKTIDRTMEWWDRKFPPGQSEALARMIFAVCGVIAGLLLVSAAVVYFVVVPRQRAANDTDRLPMIVPTPSTPVVMAPPPNVGTTPRTLPTVSTVASPTPTPTPNPQQPSPSLAAPVSDPQLQQRVAAGANGFYQVTAARRASEQNAAFLEIVLPVQTEDADKTKDRVLRTALHAAKTAGLSDGRLAAITVQSGLLVVLPQNPQMSQTVRVFEAEIPTAPLQNVDPFTAPMTDLMPMFKSLRWIAATLPGFPANTVPVAPNTPTNPPASNRLATGQPAAP
jgi:hypothetical protein